MKKSVNVSAGAIGLGFVGFIVLALTVAPAVVMFGTAYIHKSVPAVPALGFWTSFAAVVTARALVGGTAARSQS